MSKLPSSTNDTGTLAWLGQFSSGDRLLAKKLLDGFVRSLGTTSLNTCAR